MDKITQEIEDMANKMEKSVIDPKDELFTIIKSLGPEGLKEKLATLSDEDKIVLKAALEEMNIQKAMEFDKEAQGAKAIQGKVSDTIIQEEIASDDADEKLVKPAAAAMNNQGTPTDGWDGQVIKSIQDNEEQLDLVIEKAMDKCKDDKMVMKKLKEKGMDESKVQGALDKYKAKQAGGKKDEPVKEEPKAEMPFKKSEDDEIEKGKMKEQMIQEEPKEEGVEDKAPKKEPKKKEEMKKSISWDDDTRLLKANTLGRNFNFNVEQFVEETIKNEPTEPVKKSETSEDDLNDIIQKGGDRTWDQINDERQKADYKRNGSLVKSFEETDLASSLGITVEEAKKILGE